MSKALLHKKLEQLLSLIEDLSALLAEPLPAFERDTRNVRAAERNFQLIIDGAADINAHLLLDRGRPAPDAYWHSFRDLAREGIIPQALGKQLIKSARLRNVLVHDYDIEEDVKRFHQSAKNALPSLRAYIRALRAYTERIK